MIRRLYVHNFRCLENFELPILSQPSVLLIGKNGAGKTAVSFALEVLQRIARGTNRVQDLVHPEDFTYGREDVPMRFEIELELNAKIYEYVVAFGFPTRQKGIAQKRTGGLVSWSKELCVLEEKLVVGGSSVYTREATQVDLERTSQGQENGVALPIDWRLVALPIVQQRSTSDPLFIFKQWLARMIILRPIPALIVGDSKDETLEPKLDCTNLGAWFSALTVHYPASYATIDQYLKQVMPDLNDIENPVVGADTRSLIVQFSDNGSNARLPFKELSDGEKCFMICALVLAANKSYGPLFCFWDEPDNYLALSEVGHFVLALRKAFQSNGGQFMATSHNPEAIRRFSDENTLLLQRKNHLQPTTVRPLSEIQVSGNLVSALIRGDVE